MIRYNRQPPHQYIPRHQNFLLGLLFISSWFCFTTAGADTLVSGYVKNFSVVQEPVSNDLFSERSVYSSQLTGRLMWEKAGDGYALQAHYELASQFNSRQFGTQFAGTGFFNSGNSYRLTDVKNHLSSDTSKNLTLQNLDRFNLQLQLRQGDLTIGRQAITFGSARILNPTDVFLPFDVRTLNTEYRIGIDALRFQKPVGQLSEIDLGYVFGENSDLSAAFARFQTNFAGSDFEFTALEYSEQRLLGFGLESTLGPFGTWLEIAHATGDATYNRLSLGLDYGFSENWFGMLEYHYSGAGSSDPDDYLQNLSEPAYQFGGVFLLGEQYLVPTLSWQISALSSASLQVIANLDDSSAFVSVGFDRSLSDNLYLGGNLYWFTGDEIDLTLPPTTFSLGSEYGNSPSQLIVNLRYYF